MPMESLQGYPFISREHGSGKRAAMVALFDSKRVEPRFTMEMSSNETIKQAVMAAMGLALLLLHTIGLEVRSGLLAILDIEGTPVIRTWNIVRLQSKLISPAAEAFHYFIIERGETYLRAHDTALLTGLSIRRTSPPKP